MLHGTDHEAANRAVGGTDGAQPTDRAGVRPELLDLVTEGAAAFIVPPDGTGLKQITAFQTHGFNFSGDGLILSDDHPAFSSDGKQIVFTSNRDAENVERTLFEQDFDIYVMDADGTDVHRLTASPGIDTEPVFSPDGSRISLASARSGNLDIWVMNADGGNRSRPPTAASTKRNRPGARTVPSGLHAGDCRRPPEAGTVPAADKDVYIMNANGANNHLIFGGPKEQRDPSWSPDSTRLAITGEGDSIHSATWCSSTR